MKKLTTQDASFLYAESDVAHMHVGWMLVVEDETLTAASLAEHLAPRLHRAPTLRQRLASVPFGAGLPVLVDDAHFDLRHHLRDTTLPEPRGEKEVRALMEQIMSVRLPRERPLWEIWVFPMGEGRTGLIQKIHHTLVDGVSAVDLALVLMDLTPEVPPPEEIPWTPAPAPEPKALLRTALRDQVERAKGLFATARRVAASPETLLDAAKELAEGVAELAKSNRGGAPSTSLAGRPGGYGHWCPARVDLERVKAVKRVAGCTVNDVALALATEGMRRLLTARGDALDGLCLRALVPVNVRPDAARGTFGNQVSALAASLPVHEAEPRRRLELIHEQMEQLKGSKQGLAVSLWIKSFEFLPAPFAALGSQLMAHQRFLNLYVSNVPGPPVPMYLRGKAVLAALPFGPVSGHMSVGIGVVSYRGQLTFGVSTSESIPEVELVARGIEEGLSELEDALRPRDAVQEPALAADGAS